MKFVDSPLSSAATSPSPSSLDPSSLVDAVEGAVVVIEAGAGAGAGLKENAGVVLVNDPNPLEPPAVLPKEVWFRHSYWQTTSQIETQEPLVWFQITQICY